MKTITFLKDYNAAQKRMYELMYKGEGNLTKAEESEVIALGNAAQQYEQKAYTIAMPKTLYGMVELKMYEKRIN